MSANSNLLTHSHLSSKNQILNSLPKEDLERLLPDLESVKLVLGQVIYQVEEPIEYIYFPNNSMISVIATTSDGECSEVGVIGREL